MKALAQTSFLHQVILTSKSDLRPTAHDNQKPQSRPMYFHICANCVHKVTLFSCHCESSPTICGEPPIQLPHPQCDGTHVPLRAASCSIGKALTFEQHEKQTVGVNKTYATPKHIYKHALLHCATTRCHVVTPSGKANV